MPESGSGWQSGISSLVRLAAMIPASCAVVSASPFGRSCSRFAVSGAIRTAPRAVARRRESGFAPTLTICTAPVSSTCDSSLIESPPRCRLATGARAPPSAAYRSLGGLEVVQLRVDPCLDRMRADMLADRLDPAAALLGRQHQCLVDRLRLAVDVERIHGQRPLADLVVHARVLREHEHAVARV